MSCLEMLLRRHYTGSRTDPRINITIILALGSVILFNKIVKKYAPDMNEKFKNALAVIIALSIALICYLIFSTDKS